MKDTSNKICLEELCDMPILAKGLCSKHYYRTHHRAKRRAMKLLLATDSAVGGIESNDAQPLACSRDHEPIPLPFPGVESFPHDILDMRGSARMIANIGIRAVNERPDHPNRVALLEMSREKVRVADMSESQLLEHLLINANPVNRLSPKDKNHCMRVLPPHIINILFPHIVGA